MQAKEVLLVLTDRWADWEASYVIPEVNSVNEYTVKTIAIDKQPKASIGGLRAEIDYVISGHKSFDNTAMIILTGGFAWGENRYDEIADFIRAAHEAGVPVAAICGATVFLAKHGILDAVKHTGDELDYFMGELKDEAGYKGRGNFVEAQVVSDGGFITANETAALEFAREIFRLLRIDTDEEIDGWYDKFKNGIAQ